jgi:hypothetical protein
MLIEVGGIRDIPLELTEPVKTVLERFLTEINLRSDDDEVRYWDLNYLNKDIFDRKWSKYDLIILVRSGKGPFEMPNANILDALFSHVLLKMHKEDRQEFDILDFLFYILGIR